MEVLFALLITIFIFWIVSKIGGGSFIFGAAKITVKIIEVFIFIFLFVIILVLLI